MPTVAEIKIELKAKKIKGISGKNKAQLLAMLEASKSPAESHTEVSYKTILDDAVTKYIKEMNESNSNRTRNETSPLEDAIKRIGQFAWRRTNGEVKADLYEHDPDNKKTIVTFNNVKKDWSGYWDEWSPIVGKTIEFKNGLTQFKPEQIHNILNELSVFLV
jgi:hypothetical protein